jgi:uncharacterized membrane protein YccC
MASWTRSPKLLKLFVGQHIVNGLSVAGSVLTVAVAASAIFGFAAGQPATLGAISGSISDFPGPWRMKTRTMLTGFALALVSTTAIQLVDRSTIGLIVTIGVIAFASGLLTGLGRWALSLSMQMLVPMVLVMGLPPTDWTGVARHEGLLALGGLAYIALSTAVARLISASDRRMMASECFRELSAYLESYARLTNIRLDLAIVYGNLIRQQAALSDQLQTGRALLLSNVGAAPERVILAATIGILLDTFDALVAAQCDLPRLRRALVARTLLSRIGVLARATAIDLQHLSLDLVAHRTPRLPPDHSLAREAVRREADRVSALAETDEATRDTIARTMFRLDAARAEIVRLERTLSDEAAARESMGGVDLDAFIPMRTFHPRALRPHLTPASAVFRYATRLSLAMMAGAVVATALSGEAHGYWILLTIAVILRAGYGLTRSRRDDRLIGTLIGCVISAAAVSYLPIGALVALQVGSLAMTHAFVRQYYRVASIGASMMALISLHLVEPNVATAVVTRLADTIVGAAIAQLFNFFWPSWEIFEAPKIARRLLTRAADFAAVALVNDAPDQDYRLARKNLIEAMSALSDSATRMGGEPRTAQRGLDEMTQMLIDAGVFVAHVSAARLDIRAAEAALSPTVRERTDATRKWLIARLAADPAAAERLVEPDDPPLARLRAAAVAFVGAVEAYEAAAEAPRASD